MKYVVKHGNLLLSKNGKFVSDINEAILFPTREEARVQKAVVSVQTKCQSKVYKVSLSPVSYERS